MMPPATTSAGWTGTWNETTVIAHPVATAAPRTDWKKSGMPYRATAHVSRVTMAAETKAVAAAIHWPPSSTVNAVAMPAQLATTTRWRRGRSAHTSSRQAMASSGVIRPATRSARSALILVRRP